MTDTYTIESAQPETSDAGYTITPAPSPDAQGGAAIRKILSLAPSGQYIPEFALGAKQALDASAQMLARAFGAGPGNTAEQANQQTQDFYNQYFKPSAPTGAGIATGIGQGAVVAPLVPAFGPAGVIGAIGRGAASGAAGGALTPVYGAPSDADFARQKLAQAGTGALVGGGIGGVLGALGKAISGGGGGGDQQALIDAGVRLTPGQAAGGFLKSVEDKLTSFPIIGDLIKSRRFEGISDFQRAMYSKALEPFGDEGAQVAASAPIGNKGVATVGDFLSSKYEQALAQSGPTAITPEFQSAINQIASMVPRSKRADFSDVIDQQITQNITPGGTLTPSVAKSVDSALGKLYATYKGSTDGDQRVFANAIAQTQSELRDLVAASNPTTAPIIQAADQGWRTLVQIENAANAAGARADGIFSPANFLAAIKKGDTTVRDRATSRGEAWNQEFAQQAQRVLPSQVADSGTPGRAAVGGLLAALAGHGLPIAAGGVPWAVGTVTAGSVPFLPGVSPTIARAMVAPRPGSLVSLGNLVSGAAPYLAPAGLGLLGPSASQ